MDPVSLAILLASGGLVAFSLRESDQITPTPGEFDWPGFLASDLSKGASQEQRVAFDLMQEKGLPLPAEVIASPHDVLRFFGAKNEKDLSRIIYRETDCGAWAKFFGRQRTRTGVGSTTRFVANLEILGSDVRLVSLWNDSGSRVESPPEEVLSFLTIEDPESGILSGLSPGALRDVDPSLAEIEILGDRAVVRFGVWIAEWEQNNGGLLIGSTVEGTDAEVRPEKLLYPFTVDDLERAIENVEDEARFLWEEAHENDFWEADEDEW